MRYKHLAVLGAMALCLMGVPARSAAALLVTVNNAVILPGGASDIDVVVSGGGDNLASLGFEFRIVPEVGTSSQLRFLEEDEGYIANGQYLFVGNSIAQTDGLPSSVGTASTSVLPDDTFIGGDGTEDFDDVVVNTQKLLVRLRVQHDVGPADPSTTLGHSFSLSLVPLSGDSSAFLQGESNTGFLDSQFEPVAFESTAGLVTVVIPEPSSVSLVAIAVALVLPMVCRRRRNY